ncbi:hypothetical protein Aboo_0760 [Aciduliprofundum boonei T469]|uniref:Uncharacterized protein n=1 Tax=Aciduliprofundum boonei (strain DSM 19572 / T469) TaxID=439481 RepID=B5I9G2_ACIB4|nr:hypothetical protein Aboo_0760 [Aciduliprofundum boonei T469]EDY36933.1 hypothetical protein ABOONEI_1854 [Aciduliprofundum boonei T469]
MNSTTFQRILKVLAIAGLVASIDYIVTTIIILATTRI